MNKDTETLEDPQDSDRIRSGNDDKPVMTFLSRMYTQ